jgi:hypothetical protein
VHLRRGQAGAVVLVHGLEHVVDEPLDVRGRDGLGRHGLGDLPQHWMTQARDLQDGHGFVSQIGRGVARAGAIVL